MLEVNMLGPLEVREDGRPVPISGSLPRLVLGRLLVSPGRPVSCEALADDVWEGDPPATARKTLQKYVSGLRRQLGADVIRTSAAGYALGVAPAAVDAGRFEHLVSAGAYEQALALWRGDPLTDLGSPAFLLAERARLAGLRLHALEQAFRQAVDDGRAAAVLADLADAAAAHPLSEGLVGLHMVALYQVGRHVEALRAFDEHRRTLAEDVGVEPGVGLRELETAILQHDPALRPPMSATAGVPATGQLGPGNLPIALTSYIGRTDEIDAVTKLLAGNRLVTLVGPGGIGKTRLALEVAERLRAIKPGGVWFVELAPVRDDALVADTVAAALGVDVREAGDALAAVTASLASRPPSVLLVDNCEHLEEGSAAVVASLLRACPGLAVLATSRRPIGVVGEYVSPVLPLPEEGAVALLVERAARVGGTVDLRDPAQMDAVTLVCRATDGLPLAIELAASQLRVLAPAELVDRLPERLRFEGRGRDARQRNLHELLAWSHGLLPPETQRFFARLGAFVSSFALEAAEAVCCAGDEKRPNALGHITTLVDHSLLSRTHDDGHSRYRLLETVRLFALEHLDSSGEGEDAHRAHARYHLGLARRAGPHLYGPDEVAWKQRLAVEEPNLHEALRWAADHDPSLAFDLAVALWPYWDVRWGEGHAVGYLADLLASSAGRVPEVLFAWGLTVAADLSANPGDARRSTAWAEQAVALFRRLGDDTGLAHALAALGSAYANQARLDEADAVLAEAVQLGEQRQDALLLARILNFRSFVASRRGDHRAASRINRDELDLWRRLGSSRGQATALRHLAVAQWYGGFFEDAEALCQDALALWETLEDPVSVAHVQTTLADIHRVRGDLAAARRLYEAALSELRSVADRRCMASTLKNLGLISLAEDDDATALGQFRQALVLRHELGDTAGLAECLEGIALVHARDVVPSEQERAMELLCIAAAIRRSSGTPAPRWEAGQLDEALAAAATALPPGRREAAEAAAAAMTADGIVAAYRGDPPVGLRRNRFSTAPPPAGNRLG